jgi:hypothetical protein
MFELLKKEKKNVCQKEKRKEIVEKLVFEFGEWCPKPTIVTE